MISFQDFKAMELKVARITAVEDHPNADKLYVLTVDLGDHQRTLVAGIKPYYEKEYLQDKLIVVIVNLEPATIRGVQSEGMLLAAGDGEKVVFLSPEQDIAPGSTIS